VNPTSLLVAGGALSAAAVWIARRRPRRGRVRREPIDVQQLAAEFGEPPKRTEQEIIAALEAEVQRAHQARVAADPAPAVDIPALDTPAAPAPALVLAPTPTPVEATPQVIDLATRKKSRHAVDPTTAGLPLDQVRAWLEQVKDDLRKVQARVEYLQFEQTKLQSQHHLVAELISSTTSV
jgi:hypothetical protein